VPAELSELPFEVCWLVGDLHEPVGGSVGDLPAHAGTAGKLEHAAGRLECVKRLGHLVDAGEVQALVQIVRGQRPVVGELLLEKTVELVW
jgi:hypothetical protein